MASQLPNAGEALVPEGKVQDYLLNLGHPDGAPKAVFYLAFGFRRERWQELRDALLEHAQNNPIASDALRRGVVRYNVEGPLRARDGRWPLVRSVWVIDSGETRPRLITAYPLRRRDAERA